MDRFFVDKKAFSDYEELRDPIKGRTAPKGASFRVIGQGTVRKICKTADGTLELIFKDALHAPDLSSNLISINCFNKAGFNMVFGGGQVHFRDPNGREVLCGTGVGLLSLLEVLDGPTVMMARSLTKLTTLDVWHRRFGHASIIKIREALTKNLVDGLDIRGNLTVAGLCKDCKAHSPTIQCYHDTRRTSE